MYSGTKNTSVEGTMNDVFVVEALRTPFGSLGGMLADIEAPKLAAAVMQKLVEKTGLDAGAVDEVIVGQVLSGGVGQAPARQAMRAAGIPDAAHALTINKVCGSGLKAIMLGTDAIRLGNSRVVIAGGMENMSLAPYIMKKARSGYRMGHGELLDLMIYDGLQDPFTGRHMGEIGEASAERGGLTREEQDAFAQRSYQLAQAAVKEGVFRDEIVPVVKKGKKGDETLAEDEEPFRGDPAKLPQLKAVFKKDGTITAGNASTINDGAALALLTDAEGLKRHNLTPRARVVASATASMHPDNFPEAPVAAIEKVCARAGLAVGDIDLFEINEAFASVALLAVKGLNLPLEKVNVNGGACAIGHPIGASGGRLAATVIRELHRRKTRYGLATLCIGGGEAVAVIFERV
jgi:acetyl-CoA C-acetyltransferase